MGDIHLTDFGLARLAATRSRLTRTGEALGTPAYMSPEQARGEVQTLGPATDVWALGCVLYELLAGRRAFEGETTADVVGAVLTREPPRLAALRPDLPRGLADLVHAMLAKTAVARPGAAGELRADLDRVLQGQRPHVRRGPTRRRTAALAALAAALGMVATWAAWRPAAPDPAARPSAAVPDAVTALADRARGVEVESPSEAIRLLGEALAHAPARHDLRLRLGLLQWATGANAAARETWLGIPDSAPEGTLARLYRGLECAFALSRRGVFEDIAPLLPRRGPEGALARALVAIADGRRSDVPALLEGAPGWEAALLRADAATAEEGGDPAAAIRAYDEALAAGIPFAWALANRGVMRTRLGDAAGALADCEAALRHDPRNAKAHKNRGFLRYRAGDLAGALTDYDAALAEAPGYVSALVDRGLARVDTGDLRGALADYDAAIAIEPDNTGALMNRGNARRRAGDLPGSLQDLERAVTLTPDSVPALVNRGIVRGRTGDRTGARADFDAALARDPASAEALINRGMLRRADGDQAGALADLDAGLALVPRQPAALRARAGLRRTAGDTTGARTDLDAALAAEPDHAGARHERGALRLAAGDAAGAVADLTRALELAPPGWTAGPEARRQLDAARLALARTGR